MLQLQGDVESCQLLVYRGSVGLVEYASMLTAIIKEQLIYFVFYVFVRSQPMLSRSTASRTSATLSLYISCDVEIALPDNAWERSLGTCFVCIFLRWKMLPLPYAVTW